MSHSPAVLGQIWVERYEETVAFCTDHGRLPKQRECSSGKWLAKQREKARAGALHSEELRLLEKLPGFAVDQRGRGTQDHVAAVVKFASRHGRLPRVTDTGMRAHGQWIKDVRAGKVSLTPEQLDALIQVGYSASPLKDRQNEFTQRYAAYVEETSYQRVRSHEKSPDGYPLGRRYHRRRQAERAGEISTTHKTQLDEIGFPWRTRAEWQAPRLGQD